MDHSLPLISTLVIAFSLALVFGFIAERVFRSPALVGYLLAGIAAGKYTPGVVADAALASQLSEIGVMLLMFGVGLHFSLKDLWSVKSVAVPGAVLQMTIATALGACFAHWFFDRHWAEAIVLGVSLSCASTVVLLKALDVRGKLTSPDGRIAVGWLVVEDIATVLILVLLPPFANLMMPGTPGASTRLANADILWMRSDAFQRRAFCGRHARRRPPSAALGHGAGCPYGVARTLHALCTGRSGRRRLRRIGNLPCEFCAGGLLCRHGDA